MISKSANKPTSVLVFFPTAEFGDWFEIISHWIRLKFRKVNEHFFQRVLCNFVLLNDFALVKIVVK